MDSYFSSVVSGLTLADMKILGLLNDKECDASFKSITKKKLHEFSELSITSFRKSMERLEATNFISIVSGQKDHRVYITNYGQKALFDTLSKEMI